MLELTVNPSRTYWDVKYIYTKPCRNIPEYLQDSHVVFLHSENTLYTLAPLFPVVYVDVPRVGYTRPW